MENHHHCEKCGNMISPTRTICFDCESKQSILSKNKKKTTSTSDAVEEAIDKWIKLKKNKS